MRGGYKYSVLTDAFEVKVHTNDYKAFVNHSPEFLSLHPDRQEFTSTFHVKDEDGTNIPSGQQNSTSGDSDEVNNITKIVHINSVDSLQQKWIGGGPTTLVGNLGISLDGCESDTYLHKVPITIMRRGEIISSIIGTEARSLFGPGDSVLSDGTANNFGQRTGLWCMDAIVTRTEFCAHAGTLAGSDDRIKSEEEPIDSATETLLKLTPKNYFKHPSYMVDADDESAIPEKDLSGDVIEKFWESGLIAQDILKIPELTHLVGMMPDLVTGKGILAMNYTGLIPYLIKSNQELHERIKQLENNI